MLICRTTGTVVSTVKHERLHGRKLLLVRRSAPDGKAVGDPFVAVDAVGAGEGELVIVAMGSAARELDTTRSAPVDATIIGIIDSTAVGGKLRFAKSNEANA
jgi:microcompartment protein CcmK/EutM